MAKPADQIRKKIQAGAAELDARLVSRQQVTRSLLVAAIAGHHVILLGPPGTAKSYQARLFAQACGGTYFERLVQKFSTPDELFGPVKLSALKQDRFERNIAGKLPEAEVAFLDEVGKASSAILNSLLTALNERIYHNDGQPVQIPLQLCVAASNEYFGEDLAALWDRFTVRHWVEYSNAPQALRELRSKRNYAQKHPMRQVFTVRDIMAARDCAKQLPFSGQYEDAFWQVKAELAQSQIRISDRRAMQCDDLCQTFAWYEGATEVGPEHLLILSDVLWEHHDQRPTVQQVVGKASQSQSAAAQRVYDALALMLQQAPKAVPDNTEELNQFVTHCSVFTREAKTAKSKIKQLAEGQGPNMQKACEQLIEKIDQSIQPLQQMVKSAAGL